MNIFYYSVHHILEDDEVRLFQGLGHHVFCLGLNSAEGTNSPFRPPIAFGAREKHLYQIYKEMGGRGKNGGSREEILPPGFLNHFSISVVMHDPAFIIDHWTDLQIRPVVWRTIGQAVDSWEEPLRTFRRNGLKIVRYSPTELTIENSLGQDAIIRFYKDPQQYEGWTGDGGYILTFANSLTARYPLEAEEYRRVVKGLPCLLGGDKNDDFAQSIGLLDFEQQIRCLQRARIYFYFTGLHIPYTLNFVEAWMMGIPVVVLAPNDRVDRYFEIDKLVKNGETGFVCRSAAEARLRLEQLLSDQNLAHAIGENGRAAAIQLFDKERIGAQWDSLLRAEGINQ